MKVKAFAVGAAICAALLAGCSGSGVLGYNSKTSNPKPTPTVTKPPSKIPPQNLPTKTPVPSKSTPTPAGPSECLTSDLSVTLGSTSGTAGSNYITLDYTNLSNVTCTFFGYPGVSLADAQGKQIGLSAQRDPITQPVLVTLTPGDTATSLVQVVDAGNYPPASCEPDQSAFLKVYPPGETQSVNVIFSATGCLKPEQILRASPIAES